MVPCLIACRVFSSAMDYLGIQQRHPGLIIRYLPAHLHLQPVRLKERLLAEIRQAGGSKRCAGCLYGHCFEDIDEVLETVGAPRIPIAHCFEILLGKDRFRQFVQDQAATFFVEKELVENFEDDCWNPLELFDPQMRRWYFEHYRQVAYIRQPGDPDLTVKVRDIAGSLELDLKVLDADYLELARAVNDLIGKLCLR